MPALESYPSVWPSPRIGIEQSPFPGLGYPFVPELEGTVPPGWADAADFNVVRQVLDVHVVWPALVTEPVRLTSYAGGDLDTAAVVTLTDAAAVTVVESTWDIAPWGDRQILIGLTTGMRFIRVKPSVFPLPSLWTGTLRLDPRCLAVAPSSIVRALVVDSVSYAGTLTIASGKRTDVRAETNQITISQDLDSTDGCGDRDAPLRSLGGVTPDANGNVPFSPDPCFSLRRAVVGTKGDIALAGGKTEEDLILENRCGPRCPGTNYYDLAMSLRDLAANLNDQAAALADRVSQLTAVRDTVIAKRGASFKLNATPASGCRIVLAAAFRNETTVDMGPVEIRFRFTGTAPTTVVLCGQAYLLQGAPHRDLRETPASLTPDGPPMTWRYQIGSLPAGQTFGVRAILRVLESGGRCTAGTSVPFEAGAFSPDVVGGPPLVAGADDLASAFPARGYAEVEPVTTVSSSCGC